MLGGDESQWCAPLRDAGVSVDCHLDVESLVRAIGGGMRAPEVVLWECASRVDREGLASAVRRSVSEVLELVQGWFSNEELAATRLLILTRDSVAIQDGEQMHGLVDSAVWGLIRSGQSENPGRLLLRGCRSQRAI